MFQVVYKTPAGDAASWSYQLPPAEDPDGDVFVTDIIDSAKAMKFVEFDLATRSLKIPDLSSEDVPVGSFRIRV